ncbi:MAG TPA: TetR family transcriptional regulator [Glycomyces sp.]|nr:TetR family transcriptional regulator [Glycomyces sp.]
MRGEPLDAESIVSATEEVLRRHGPEKATVLDVARLLGVSHGSVYRHFPSKAALREAVIRRWLDQVEKLVAATQETGTAPPERLRRLLLAMFAAKWAKAGEDPELFGTFGALAAEHSTVCSAHTAFVLDQVRAVIVEGVDAGDFAAGEPEALARAVIDATCHFHDPVYAVKWNAPDLEARAEAVVSLILSGLRTR